MEPTKTEEVHPCWICLSDESDDNDKLPVEIVHVEVMLESPRI